MCYVVPFGYGYAILRNRVIDLGFALNPAAVFAATTPLLVGLFGALQWGVDRERMGNRASERERQRTA